MTDLAAKDSYIQKLAGKLFSQQEEKEPKKRPFGKNAVLFTLYCMFCVLKI